MDEFGHCLTCGHLYCTCEDFVEEDFIEEETEDEMLFREAVED